MTQTNTPDYLRTQAGLWHVKHALSEALPPPRDPSPEALEERNAAALAHLEALKPANALEACFAVQCIAASAQALACLRLANQPDIGTALAVKCTAQAASMMRQSHTALRELLRLQAPRRAEAAAAAKRAAAAAVIASAVVPAPAQHALLPRHHHGIPNRRIADAPPAQPTHARQGTPMPPPRATPLSGALRAAG